MSHILIVEDEPVIRGALRKLLERHDHSVVEADSIEQALAAGADDFDLIISDLRLPGAPGTELITLARPTPVLIMTSYASLRSAVDAMRLGAVDYIAKPFDHEEMVLAVNRILDERALARGNDALQADLARSYPTAEVIAQCPAMQALMTQVERVAASEAGVLILGESGTGKELFARFLHQRSSRRRAPLISFNCAALSAEEQERQLFGSGEQSAAGRPQKGLVETADGGLLFVDEIDELSSASQGRLLRLLENQTVQRPGASEPHRVNVRVIAASHRDLARLTRQGQFREDLYYRLNVVTLPLPPLRERGADILRLADTLLTRSSARLNLKNGGFTDAARDAMARYSWPGNVRELGNAIERALILADGQPLTVSMLGIDGQTFSRPLDDPGEDLSLEDYFTRFVVENQEHMTETELARKLGISRKCLWERRQRLGIPRNRQSASG